jgi:alpha-beta hydrolase superfamily lysophospholipase
MPSVFTKPQSPGGTLQARHFSSGLNSRFAWAGMEFSAYVAASRQMLLKAHSAKPSGLRERVVDGNAPFDLMPCSGAPKGRDKSYRRGVLLAHGLTDSPYSMRPLAEFFRKQGFRVMAILLPGHGTQPGDLLEVRWQEWAEAFAYGVDQLALEADEIYLAGYSAGATLAVRHSLMDERVRGLFLFSPALNVPFLGAWTRLQKLCLRMLPVSRWKDIKPDDDLYKYESFAKNAGFQMCGLIADLKAMVRARAPRVPVFVAASADDATVESAATLDFVARLPHPQSKLVYYAAASPRLPAGMPEGRAEVVNSAVPEQNIVSFSHLSLLIPPEDAHYGVAGDYSNCLHYFPGDMDSYASCRRNAPPVLQGEVSRTHLRAGVMRRLTYNPHFAGLESSIQQFIERLP